jgi:chitinase
MKTSLFSRLALLLILLGSFFNGFSQDNDHLLVGFWHNWNDFNAPYIPLDQIDERYDVVALSFAIPAGPDDMTMQFVPDGTSPAMLQSQIELLKGQGKKVLISVGGATASVNLNDSADKDDFVQSMNTIIEEYGFNGLDIDIEHGSSILAAGGTIVAPEGPAQINLIEAVREIMAHYHETNGEKLYLTFTPETAYVQGGQSGFGGIWGGYLPIIHALRDSIDILQVQLYNSGTMFGIDGGVYTQGTADFIISQTEAVMQGFVTAGGFFQGFPANKVAVGLPACSLAAGGGYVESETIIQAMNYLRGYGLQPGDYSLAAPGGYPDLKGLMTWSINWDAVSSCDGNYAFADAYEEIFNVVTDVADTRKQALQVFPNPAGNFVWLKSSDEIMDEELLIFDVSGRVVLRHSYSANQAIDVSQLKTGTYFMRIGSHVNTLIKN